MKLRREVDKKTSELKVYVEVDSNVWKEQQAKTKKTLLKNVVVPGFRKGKAPAAQAEARVSQAEVLEKAVNKLLPEVAEAAAKEVTKDDIVLDQPSYTINKITADELELVVIYPVFPEIDLKGYKDTGIKFEEPTVTEEDVKEQTAKMLKQHAVQVSVDGPVKMYNTIIFDFEGFIDGQPFEGGTAEDFELKIGSGHFIPGFEDALIGKEKGFEGEINVTFPENYHMKDYAGKPAIFKVKIKDIKDYDLPELNDEFITSLSIPNVKTLAELNTYLKDLTERERTEAEREKFRQKLFENIMKETELVFPKSLLLKEMQKVNTTFEGSLKEQGFSRKEYLELTGLSEDQIAEQVEMEAVKNLKTSLIFADVAKKENLEATEEDYKEEYTKLAKIYNIPKVEDLEAMLPKQNLQIPILNRKVVDKLIELNK
ncbi:trigger factor [Candidatus Mycoplasma pogonae]